MRSSAGNMRVSSTSLSAGTRSPLGGEADKDAFLSETELQAMEAELSARGDVRDDVEWEVSAYVVSLDNGDG